MLLRKFALLTAIFATAAFAKTADFSVTVDGDVANTLNLSVADLADMPRTSVRVTDRTGASHVYDGVALSEILNAAAPVGADGSEAQRNRYAITVIARDGFGATFSVADVDSTLTANPPLLADKFDGQPLNSGSGPLRLVSPNDLKPERWIKQVKSITVRFL